MSNISVVIPTFNPNLVVFRKVLIALGKQTLDASRWELIVVDNNSEKPVIQEWCEEVSGRDCIVIREERSGLSFARATGVRLVQSDLLVFCDDDNVFEERFLSSAVELMVENKKVGVAGGKIHGSFESEIPAWYSHGVAPLGCQDFGDGTVVYPVRDFFEDPCYPPNAPIGAGMVIRKSAINSWLELVGSSSVPDRQGEKLSSAGDCDIVIHALKAGYDVAYFPELKIWHLISVERLEVDYLCRISRAASRDFIRVLRLHGISPWTSISKWSLPFRAIRSFLRLRPWMSIERRIRWFSDLGHFEGRCIVRDNG